ncbi:MAG: GNAT family N-acetyltransferase [Alphaproteobacteria bacterium]|nr:GNAT family N-acetyltransferase [Alphaproteobacteria bacterium]
MTRHIETTVTYLEMTAPPSRRLAPALGAATGRFATLRAVSPPVHFYRYLYDTIGARWTWTERKVMGDEELASIIKDPLVEIYVMYADGAPAGFIELDFRGAPAAANIALLGVMPEWLGQRLGPTLLAHGLDIAWVRSPERVTINTCTLDHPRALPLYQRAGFVPVNQRVLRLPLP